MGNSYGFLRNESGSGFQFNVVEVCKAENVNLAQACKLTFDVNQDLISIGNVTRGRMVPQPGIAGLGIWIAMVLFFVVVVISLIFVFIEVGLRADVSQIKAFEWFRDKPNIVKTPENPNADPTWKDRVRAAGRTFVLGVADTQTIFVGAFLLGFAGRNKCKLTSYHFTVAVSQMMIALSVLTFSIALVRTYWRSPFAAGFRLLLSIGAFVGVGLTIFREANYAPYGALEHSNRDSAILLPVACMLELDLRSAAEEQAHQNQVELGFGNATAWPPERYMYIVLGVAFIAAHMSVPIRYAESKDRAPKVWTEKRAFVTFLYWFVVLLTPIVTSIFCWLRVYTMRKWVAKSGWMEDPNTEMIVWDSGQLIAMGVLITVIMNVLTEAKERKKKDAEKKSGETDGEESHEMLPFRELGFSPMYTHDYGDGSGRSSHVARER